jgi:hypothetical protein
LVQKPARFPGRPNRIPGATPLFRDRVTEIAAAAFRHVYVAAAAFRAKRGAMQIEGAGVLSATLVIDAVHQVV